MHGLNGDLSGRPTLFLGVVNSANPFLGFDFRGDGDD